MIINLFYIVCALLGLSFLVFIHELGHYFMARKVGMKVEIFSIGFGRPIYSWKVQGIVWQICLLPFGGYVKIAGMEKKGNLEPHQIPDGFFGKSPADRIKVALAGPVVNLVFALLLFTVIWVTGGRLKPFSEYTQIVGWVEPQSKPSQMGIVPGDKLEKIAGKPIHNFMDLLYGVVLNGDQVTVEGEKVDYWNGEQRPFSFVFERGSNSTIEKQAADVQAIVPASFLFYDSKLPVEQGSPMSNSGIRPGDRILWIDGELVFSQPQLLHIINQPRVLLTVQRGDSTFLARVPRLMVSDLQLSEAQKGEIGDWRNELGLEEKLSQLFFIPYNLTNEAVVESALTYVTEQAEHCSSFDPLKQGSCSPLEKPLLAGDKIVAVNGLRIQSGFSLLSELQERKVLIAVANEPAPQSVSWKDDDKLFIKEIDGKVLESMVNSIGTEHFIAESGKLRFLNLVAPKAVNDFPQSTIKNQWLQTQEAYRAEIEKIKDPEIRKDQMKLFEVEEKRLRLGVGLANLQVSYNPTPFVLFGDALDQTWHTLKALVVGNLTPKAVSGPVGIVHVMHHSWTKGVKEALFWLGLVSLNLGVFNLLPIPVLDGGHITFSLWEAVTKRKIKAKTMERLIIPFVVLLVVFFIFTTYNDISRLVSRFF